MERGRSVLMMEYVAVFLLSAAAFSLMGWALHFSRYKRGGRACCRRFPNAVPSPPVGEGRVRGNPDTVPNTN